MVQWVKAPAFGSGHDLGVLGSSPVSGSLLSREPASPSLCLPLCLLVVSVCQINKCKNLKKRIGIGHQKVGEMVGQSIPGSGDSRSRNRTRMAK